jgi:hypothetical protein
LTKFRYISDAVNEFNLDFIGVMETGKQDMSQSNLSRLTGGAEFVWHCLPPRGRSRGILLGVRRDIFDLTLMVEGEFFVKFHLNNRVDNFKWILMAVYGPAQEDFKTAFLTELVRTCQQNYLPILIERDFNMMSRKEKNQNNFNMRWPFLFNAIIDNFDLREIELNGRQFTWANSLPNPTYEKLDRVLMSTEWKVKYPIVSVQVLDRGVSDHTPLYIDTGSPVFPGGSKPFRFELSWFAREDFFEKVVDMWNKPVKGNNSVQRWNRKLGTLRSFLRGWSRHDRSIYKHHKNELQITINNLDVTAEGRDLSEEEQEQLAHAREDLSKLLREEEIKYYQRAKAKDIILRDNDTRYFQMIANGKHRKKIIRSLDHEGVKIEGQTNLKNYITEFYKGLFGDPLDNNISLDEEIIQDITQVSPSENELLTAPFTIEEVKEAIFQMEKNKAPGPNGFPVEFYQKF